jgi:hypothetical protein
MIQPMSAERFAELWRTADTEDAAAAQTLAESYARPREIWAEILILCLSIRDQVRRGRQSAG